MSLGNGVLVLVIPAIAWILGGAATAFIEWKYFNRGICPDCGRRLEYFDSDSQGERCYCCRNCGYVTWVSYSFVDKDFEEGNV